MSLADIAARAGVTKATASKVMNHYPGVSAATRQRVWDAAKAIGVSPRPYRTAAGDAERTILLLPMADSLFRDLSKSPKQISAQTYHAFQQALTARNYDLLLGPTGLGDSEAIRYVRQSIGRRFTGVALMPPVRPALTDFLHHRRIPAVCLSGSVDDPNIAVVTADHAQGTRMLVRHLLELGHRHIGYLGSGMQSRSQLERLQAFLLETHLAGWPAQPQWILQPSPADQITMTDRAVERWHTHIEKYVNDLVTSDSRPSAIVCVNDDFARKTIALLSVRGLSVPEDISITGWGNETELSLTTVDAQSHHIGEVGAQWLIAQMRDKDSNIGRLSTPTRLVIGSSTSKPK